MPSTDLDHTSTANMTVPPASAPAAAAAAPVATRHAHCMAPCMLCGAMLRRLYSRVTPRPPPPRPPAAPAAGHAWSSPTSSAAASCARLRRHCNRSVEVGSGQALVAHERADACGRGARLQQQRELVLRSRAEGFDVCGVICAQRGQARRAA
eukprot:248771-Chlamydomonas_euryale.AAC.1